MTLILTYVGFPGVLQVSDRLVSQAVGGKRIPFDSTSNKTVVFAASNGVAVISYTGLSFLNGVHTDRWVAECLLGRPVNKKPRDPLPMMVGGGGLRGWLDIGRAVDRLQLRLAEAMARVTPSEWRRQPLTLVIAGVAVLPQPPEEATPIRL